MIPTHSAVHVVPTYYPATRYGGPVESVHALCGALVEHGWTTDVATTNVDGPGESDVPLDTPVVRDGVTVWYSRSTFGRRLYWSRALGRRIDALARQRDLVHAHASFLWPTWKAARAARAAQKLFVVSPRGMLVPELIRARGSLRKRAWIALIERHNLMGAAAIHVTSLRERDDLQRLALGELPPVAVIPNGVQIPPSSARARSSDRVVFLGRISWKKRIDWLIDALVRVPRVTLVVAGPDDEALTPALMKRARDAGVAERVTFTGAVDGVRKRELLEDARVLVLPSISENFGNVVVEAMAHGCPVVVTPGVGAATLVGAAQAGIVADDDAGSVAAAIATVLADTESAGAMGERGRAFAQANLTWTGVAAQMTALYGQLLDARSAHAR